MGKSEATGRRNRLSTMFPHLLARVGWVTAACVLGLVPMERADAQPPARTAREVSDEGREPPDLDDDESPRPGRWGHPPEGRPRGMMGGPRRWQLWPEAERKQVESFMEESFPRLYVELQRLHDAEPARYARRMTMIGPQMRKIMETLRSDPRLGAVMIRERQIEMEIRQTAARYRRATDEAAKKRLRVQVEELAGKAFDCRHERRELEIKELEARLTVLKDRLSQAESMRPGLIRQRVSKLLEHPPPEVPLFDDAESDVGEEAPVKNKPE